jgi:hypothetical protein
VSSFRGDEPLSWGVNMSARRKTAGGGGSGQPETPARRTEDAPCRPVAEVGLPPRYVGACRLAGDGRYDEARAAYARLPPRVAKKDGRLRGLIQNDLAVLDAVEGTFEEGRDGWRRAIEADGELLLARLNRDLVEAEICLSDRQEEAGELKLVPVPGSGQLPVDRPDADKLPVSGSRFAEGSGQAAYLAAGAASVDTRESSHHAPRDGFSVNGGRNHHAERDDYLGLPASRSRFAERSPRAQYSAASAASVDIRQSSHHAPRDESSVDREATHHAKRDPPKADFGGPGRSGGSGGQDRAAPE